ncbi:hypothetical protein DPM19_06365 [Actinomadura craniellae]|uniref:Uncharacterized protein n=1 Tax=Actinomadura craniellae TaxID=2231787 RepID=A0A365HBM3_9ACTN|nr:HGxxPAAW family protein [Actinomadura craniellae]RAY16485.1 hypothetical protein DPM19_06365 [Actinomadura craniellae]
MSADHVDHGNTPAAWTAVTIILLGSCAIGWAVVAGSVPLGAAGAAVVVIGAVVGKVMQMMGLGKKTYVPSP